MEDVKRNEQGLTMAELPWTAERIEAAMLGFFSGDHFCEVDLKWNREDMVFVSSANYVTIVEIKTSLSDWKADFKKDKWKSGFSEYIKNFYFAVPAHLAENPPKEIPDCAGIISIVTYPNGDWPKIIKTCKAQKKAKKLHDNIIRRWYRNYYFRSRYARAAELDAKYRPRHWIHPHKIEEDLK